MQYTTVENYPVVIGGVYEQRHGGRVVIVAFYKDLIIGVETLDGRPLNTRGWDAMGNLRYSSGEAAEDLMRPWKQVVTDSDRVEEGCECYNPVHCWGGLKGICAVCRKCIVVKEPSPEKKQTLLEAFDEYDNKPWAPSRRDDMEFISGYLEGLE